MRPGPPPEVLSGTAGWRCRVASYLGTELLARDIPVSSGRVTADSSAEVPERLSLVVPGHSVYEGHRRAWCPREDPRHPLARYGQQLDVRIVVESAVTRQAWETRIGRFIIQSWNEDDDGAVTVEASGVLQRVSDDRIITPTSPLLSSTLVSEFQRLLPTGMTVVVDPSLQNRVCPRSFEWSEDRLAALYDIADAWPARLRTGADGKLLLLPALPDEPPATPALRLVDGQRGTVVSAPRFDTRDRAYNRVVARAADSDNPDSPPVQAVANLTTGPMAISGPYGVVTRFYSSTLITTTTQAKNAAAAILRRAVLPSRAIPIELAPDPRLDLDDAVAVEVNGDRWIGFVTTYDLPLTVPDGAMQITVGIGVDEEEE